MVVIIECQTKVSCGICMDRFISSIQKKNILSRKNLEIGFAYLRFCVQNPCSIYAH